jgi:hypothetical protein
MGQAIAKAEMRLVRRVLRLFMAELRAILKRRWKEHYRLFPGSAKPCRSCAFAPSTDQWKGWDTTAIRLMEAIRDDRPFYCHANMPYDKKKGWVPDLKNLQICAGWTIIATDPATKSAFMKAVLKGTASRKD